MTALKLSIAAVSLTLVLLMAPVAQGAETDQITIAPTGALSPEGWAEVKVAYSCAPRPGTTTYLDSAVIQTWGRNGEFGTSSFDDLSGPLTCDGRTHRIWVVSGADLEPYHFVLGPAQAEASFWNDVLGHWNYPEGFGPRVSASVELAVRHPARAHGISTSRTRVTAVVRRT
jgi:hypothetical protein